MANSAEQPFTPGQHIDIPSQVLSHTAMKNDSMGRSLWANGGSVLVFILAASVPTLPLILLVLLFRQEADLGWLWITMTAITELIAFLVAFGLVRSVLEADR